MCHLEYSAPFLDRYCVRKVAYIYASGTLRNHGAARAAIRCQTGAHAAMISKELIAVLTPALSRCPHFDDACKFACWAPELGHVPRGFFGSKGPPSDIRLVLVNAEPGNPAAGETYEGSAISMITQHEAVFERLSLNNRFHRNLSRILDYCWPGLSKEERWARTWYTNTVLCSAKKSGGPVPMTSVEVCIRNYLQEQIALMPDAFVLALGGKARNRLRRLNVHVHGTAMHPSARPTNDPDPSWREAGRSFRAWYAEHHGKPVPDTTSVADLDAGQCGGE